MSIVEITDIIGRTERYNFHSHSEFCDGRAPISEIVKAACIEGFEVWGVTPHSPINVDSPCNMMREDIPKYLAVMDSLKESYDGKIQLLTSLEIDYMSRDFGPHIDYFQNLPLDYRLGSVHFVPNQERVHFDCDGSVERFSRYLQDAFHGDLRYVVEKYFEQVLTMIESGGFDMLGHFDKIIGNASAIDPEIEHSRWYEALVDDVVAGAKSNSLVVEINTKAIIDRKRFFPATIWWEKLINAGLPLAVNSDCHYPDRTNLGRPEALEILRKIRNHTLATSD